MRQLTLSTRPLPPQYHPPTLSSSTPTLLTAGVFTKLLYLASLVYPTRWMLGIISIGWFYSRFITHLRSLFRAANIASWNCKSNVTGTGLFRFCVVRSSGSVSWVSCYSLILLTCFEVYRCKQNRLIKSVIEYTVFVIILKINSLQQTRSLNRKHMQ